MSETNPDRRRGLLGRLWDYLVTEKVGTNYDPQIMALPKPKGKNGKRRHPDLW